jgi:hypothetical protein
MRHACCRSRPRQRTALIGAAIQSALADVRRDMAISAAEPRLIERCPVRVTAAQTSVTI